MGTELKVMPFMILHRVLKGQPALENHHFSISIWPLQE